MEVKQMVLPNERCWQTGQYDENCFCDFCDHRDECSGYEDEDED